MLILIFSHTIAPATHGLNREQILKRINLAAFAEESESDSDSGAPPPPAEAMQSGSEGPNSGTPVNSSGSPAGSEEDPRVMVQG